MKLTLFILFTFFVLIESNGLGFLGCCGGLGPGPYPAGTMTPSGYPIYGMAPHASDAVAYSSPGSSYGYGSSSGGYGSSGGGYGYGGSSMGGYSAPSSMGGGYYGGSDISSGGGGGSTGGIDFDSIPYGNAPPGSQPIAIRYFKEAIPVDIDPARLRPLGPTQLMRMPVYGISRSYQSGYQPSSGYHSMSSGYHHSTPNLYRPAGGYSSNYDKFAHPVQSDIARGYQPSYSNWNRQPIQAVFRQSESPSSRGGSSSGGSSSMGSGQSSSSSGWSGSENIAPVRPAPVEESSSSGFSEMPSSSSSSGSDFSASSRSGGSEGSSGSSHGLEISSSRGSESGAGSSSATDMSEPVSKGSSSFPDIRSEVKSEANSKTGFPDLAPSQKKIDSAFPDIAAPKEGSTSGSISNSGNAFPDIRSQGSKAGSFQAAEASMPNRFRARAAAATSSAASQHASELKPINLQNLPRKSTGAENYKLSGEVLDAVNALLLEREKAAH